MENTESQIKTPKPQKAVKVCSYGARLMGGEAANGLALSVMRGQNKLWNALVEIEGRSREGYRQALQDSDVELGDLTKTADAEHLVIDALFEARNKERAKQRSKKGEKAESYAPLIKASKERLAQIRKGMKECKTRAKEAAKPLLEKLELDRRAAVAQAVRESGLWWGHSETTLAKFDVARVRAMKEGAQLRFHRFDGEGSMGVRFTVDGGSMLKILGGKTKLITMREPTPEELGRALAVKADGGRRVVVRMRAGDKLEDNSVPFLEFMVTMHKGMEFPDDMPLKTVTATRKMHVNKAEWGLTFTFSKEVDSSQPLPELPTAAVGIDFGFRVVREDNEKALRVAAISYGTKVEYVTLNGDWMRRMDRADRLRSELADSANIFNTQLLAMLTEDALKDLPDTSWFKILAQKAKRAKAAYPSLLMDVCKAHAKEEMPLGEDADEQMQVWYHNALKLAVQAHHCKRKAIDHRKHLFRNAAARLVASAGLIGLENADFRDIAKLEKPDGSDTELVQTARKYRAWAAPSELRLAIEQTAKREKREITKVDAPNTTRECSSCGHVHEHAIEDLTFVCQGCGKVWDQDENAAHNCRNIAMKAGETSVESTA